MGIDPEVPGQLDGSTVGTDSEIPGSEVNDIPLLPAAEAVTRRKKKIATATYLYQADCDGEWGEIYIDFVNKKTKIIQLADWDLTRSRVYARTVIRYLISTGGRNLRKKRRVSFDPQRPPRRQHKRKFGISSAVSTGTSKEFMRYMRHSVVVLIE